MDYCHARQIQFFRTSKASIFALLPILHLDKNKNPLLIQRLQRILNFGQKI